MARMKMARINIRASETPSSAPLSSGFSERREKIISGRSRTLVEISPGVLLRELASQASSVQGMSTGLAIFSPASALPYHRHDVSEAFTVLSGDALAMVEGRTSNSQTIRTIAWAADVRQDRTLPENGTAANRGRQKLRFQTLHIAELGTFRRLTLPEISSPLLLMCPTYSLLDIRRSD